MLPGRVPRIVDLATEPGSTREQVSSGLQLCGTSRPARMVLCMAHPFTVVPLGFSVMGRDTL